MPRKTAAAPRQQPPRKRSFAEAAHDLPETSEMVAALRDAARKMRDVRAPMPERHRVAVLLPCHNEAASIADVVASFRATLPDARIIVFDNASSDATAACALAAGAEVFFERRPGKGHVVRRMFSDIEADIYLMADGDGTYDASSAPRLIAMVADEGLDMAVGGRTNIHNDAHRKGHAIGNRLFNMLYGTFFGHEFGDIFSGYRAFSRRFVKSFPSISSGFEIETEISVHASQLMLATGEIALDYGVRTKGSESKLRTFRDGWRILKTFAYMLKETRPALFFGVFALLFAGASISLAVPLVVTYLHTALVPRLPTAIACTGLMIMASLSCVCGFILDSLARSRLEQKRMLFLALADRRR